MTAERCKYDVAISFVYRDLTLAQAIRDKLADGFEVFFFPGKQEVLAGTDGLESMGVPFRSESLLNVVLYRPEWGNTPWTRVEEAAVKDSCLATGFSSLFFFVVEHTKELPKWLPQTHVRFNYADFTLEQAVGAIKARIQERGGEYRPLTPIRKAELLKLEEDFRHDKDYLLSSQCIPSLLKEVENLFTEICAQIDNVNAGGHFTIQYTSKVQPGVMEQRCNLSEGRVGMTVTWFQPFSNLLDDSKLIVRQFDESLFIHPGYMRLRQPQILSEVKYIPDVSRAREYGWQVKQEREAFISSKDLASKLVIQFLDLVEKDRTGTLRRRGEY